MNTSINTPIKTPLIYAENTASKTIVQLQSLVSDNRLPLTLEVIRATEKLTQKNRQHLSEQYAKPILVIDEKQVLSLLADGSSVSPDWTKHQKRIVGAGRKSELILQACKLVAGNRVLDATAGFGHDSLILGSTGANVIMLERNPLIALLLLHEQALMATQKNWQKLMSRLTIHCTDATTFMQSCVQDPFNVVYLDPMFPDDSYSDSKTGKGAKVGKHMQALHHIASPPDSEEERLLLSQAKACTLETGRVVVKRPVSAPNIASQSPDETWQNDVVRFDGYFKGGYFK